MKDAALVAEGARLRSIDRDLDAYQRESGCIGYRAADIPHVLCNR